MLSTIAHRVVRSSAAMALAAGLLSGASHAGPIQLKPPRGAVIPLPMRTTTLPNGLQVVAIERRGSGMFALYEVVGTGSVDEVEPAHTGFAHFFEHMMFRGTARFPKAVRNNLLSDQGVDDGGYTTDDFTVYHAEGPAEALPAILELEGDRFQNLKFSESDFRTEAKAVLGEYNKNASNPDRKAHELLRDLAFNTHTYGHTTLGLLKDIKKMPNEYVYAQDFFRRFYTPDNTILVLVGDFDGQAATDLAIQHFASWKGQRTVTKTKAEPRQQRAQVKRVSWPSPLTTRVMMGWRVPANAPADNKARDAGREAAALCAVLGTMLFDPSSPLYNELVVDQQRVQNVSMWWWPHRDEHLFPVNLEVKNKADANAVMARVQKALDDVAAGHIDATRLAAVKSHIKNRTLLELNTTGHIADTIGFAAGATMWPPALDAHLVQVDKVTPQALQAFAKKHFSARQQNAVVLSHAGVTP